MILNAAFSFGRDRDLVHRFEEVLTSVVVHDIRSDVDANRSWVSISGEDAHLQDALMGMCGEAFERIDLQRHVGGIPRTGALDCVTLVGNGGDILAKDIAEALSRQHQLPTFLTTESDAWSVLHEQGFGSLLDRVIRPDFGPEHAHPSLGITGIGVRRPFVAVVVDVAEERAESCGLRVQDIRNRRADGEAMFAGVEAFAFPAPSDACSRMIIEFGDPDQAPPDPVLEWLTRRVKGAGVGILGMSLIGCARQTDLLETRSIPVRPEQIVD